MPNVVTQRCHEQDSNLRPTDRKPKCLPVTPPRHLTAIVYRPNIINTIIKTTSVCDGDARSVGGGRGSLAGDTDGLAGRPVTVGVVEVGVIDTRYGVSHKADAER